MDLKNFFNNIIRIIITSYQRIYLIFLAPFINKNQHYINKKPEEHYEKLSINVEFVKNICNEHFRLIYHLTQLEKIPNLPRSVHRLRTTAENLKQIFEQQGIEYYDLTGQDYHEGRLDFENIALAEIDLNLNKPKIVICESPAIFLNGKLIQCARGIVARPP